MTEQLHHLDPLPPHILVVDDEADIRQMLSAVLQKYGLKVSCAMDTAEACNLLVVDQFDAVISDVMMPGEDGITFLGRVHSFWPDIPVILMTGHAHLQMAVSAIKNGAFDFVFKPLDFDHLCKILLRAVNYRKLQKLEKNYRFELEDALARRTTELRNAIAELDVTRASLLQAATEKNTRMSTISHEMRTPMNGVIGSLILLAEQGVQGVAAEYLSMARQSADTMMDLINQLLTYNDLKGQGCAAPRELINLEELYDSLASKFQPLATRRGLELSVQLANDLPHTIYSDREKLARLLEILLGNALKFADHGSVLLVVSRSRTDKGAEMLQCSVTDSGCGIPDGMLEQIFEPFVQGDGSYSRRFEGIGLGLAVARQLATLLDGELWAEHVPGGGSRFMLTIKLGLP